MNLHSLALLGLSVTVILLTIQIARLDRNVLHIDRGLSVLDVSVRNRELSPEQLGAAQAVRLNADSRALLLQTKQLVERLDRPGGQIDLDEVGAILKRLNSPLEPSQSDQSSSDSGGGKASVGGSGRLVKSVDEVVDVDEFGFEVGTHGVSDTHNDSPSVGEVDAPSVGDRSGGESSPVLPARATTSSDWAQEPYEWRWDGKAHLFRITLRGQVTIRAYRTHDAAQRAADSLNASYRRDGREVAS